MGVAFSESSSERGSQTQRQRSRVMLRLPLSLEQRLSVAPRDGPAFVFHGSPSMLLGGVTANQAALTLQGERTRTMSDSTAAASAEPTLVDAMAGNAEPSSDGDLALEPSGGAEPARVSTASTEPTLEDAMADNAELQLNLERAMEVISQQQQQTAALQEDLADLRTQTSTPRTAAPPSQHHAVRSGRRMPPTPGLDRASSFTPRPRGFSAAPPKPSNSALKPEPLVPPTPHAKQRWTAAGAVSFPTVGTGAGTKPPGKLPSMQELPKLPKTHRELEEFNLQPSDSLAARQMSGVMAAEGSALRRAFEQTCDAPAANAAFRSMVRTTCSARKGLCAKITRDGVRTPAAVWQQLCQRVVAKSTDERSMVWVRLKEQQLPSKGTCTDMVEQLELMLSDHENEFHFCGSELPQQQILQFFNPKVKAQRPELHDKMCKRCTAFEEHAAMLMENALELESMDTTVRPALAAPGTGTASKQSKSAWGTPCPGVPAKRDDGTNGFSRQGWPTPFRFHCKLHGANASHDDSGCCQQGSGKDGSKDTPPKNKAHESKEWKGPNSKRSELTKKFKALMASQPKEPEKTWCRANEDGLHVPVTEQGTRSHPNVSFRNGCTRLAPTQSILFDASIANETIGASIVLDSGAFNHITCDLKNVVQHTIAWGQFGVIVGVGGKRTNVTGMGVQSEDWMTNRNDRVTVPTLVLHAPACGCNPRSTREHAKRGWTISTTEETEGARTKMHHPSLPAGEHVACAPLSGLDASPVTHTHNDAKFTVKELQGQSPTTGDGTDGTS